MGFFAERCLFGMFASSNYVPQKGNVRIIVKIMKIIKHSNSRKKYALFNSNYYSVFLYLQTHGHGCAFLFIH